MDQTILFNTEPFLWMCSRRHQNANAHNTMLLYLMQGKQWQPWWLDTRKAFFPLFTRRRYTRCMLAIRNECMNEWMNEWIQVYLKQHFVRRGWSGHPATRQWELQSAHAFDPIWNKQKQQDRLPKKALKFKRGAWGKSVATNSMQQAEAHAGQKVTFLWGLLRLVEKKC